MSNGEATDKVAELVGEDPFARFLGAEVLEIRPGWAKVKIQLRREHLNFLGMVHGGVIFSLADIAFSAASNSFGTKAVALSVCIDFLAAADTSDVLTAEVELVSRAGKTGNYAMRVLNSGGKVIALCRGWVYHTGKPHEVARG
jgi:acyl-CoA thioesterase